MARHTHTHAQCTRISTTDRPTESRMLRHRPQISSFNGKPLDTRTATSAKQEQPRTAEQHETGRGHSGKKDRRHSRNGA